MSVSSSRPFGGEPARLLSRTPWERWPLWARALLVLGLATLLTGVGYAALLYYPDTSPPRGTEAERRIAAVFGLPRDADAVITGDLLVERFYAVDAETGDHYVADILKGRVQGVQETVNENGIVTYALLLDLGNLQRDRGLLAAFVDQVARPAEDQGYYLGLRVPVGLQDAFLLNYDGLLPPAYAAFQGPDGEDLYEFLVGQRFADVSLGARLIGIEGFNYLLSNTELFSYFRDIFRLNKAVFLSELLLVDTTSRKQASAYFRLLEQYPRPLQQR